MPTRFRRDTAVTPVAHPDSEAGGSGAERAHAFFEARVDEAWWVARGPNGGYLAAIILRALGETVADADRAPRSLTTHFVAPPEAGVITIATNVERRGRSLTTCTARVEQGDRLIALGVAAFSTPRPGPEFCDLVRPEVADPATIAAETVPADAPPIARRWDTRWAIGERPWTGGAPSPAAIGGGWIRLEEPQPFDAPVLAAVTDAWIPPVFSRAPVPMVVPTVDLTVHFRAGLPHPGIGPEDFLLAVFRTNVSAGGFLEEDGEVWAADGTLLAQSRQLAAILPLGA
ncbi:MAG: thioesterase family protein [Acidimicrobiia bacterium]